MRTRFSHTSVIAYLALFLALGGTGFAAQQTAHVAGSSPVKVRCSATRSGKHVGCKVVKGSGVGPRGPRGPQGNTGNNGASGPTTYSDPPAFTFVEQTPGVPPSSAVSVTTGELHNGEQYQNIALYTQASQDISATAPGEPILQTYVNGPTEFDGSPVRFYGASFCYGGQLSIHPTTEQLTHVALVEEVENNGPVPPGTAQPPAYTPVTVWSAPITNAVAASSDGAGGCMSVGPSSPVAVQPNGMFALWFTSSYTAPSSDTVGVQITFGRITTTFGP
jgi:hypothetical protein